MTLRDDYVAKLSDENDELRERVRQLETMLGMRFDCPPVFGFTRAEAIIFGMLLKNRLCLSEALMFAIYQDRDEVEIKIIDVWVCKMRKKLEPFGIEIQTQWGQGYFLKTACKAKASALIIEANAA